MLKCECGDQRFRPILIHLPIPVAQQSDGLSHVRPTASVMVVSRGERLRQITIKTGIHVLLHRQRILWPQSLASGKHVADLPGAVV